MKAYNDIKVEPNKGRELLHAGGYVAKIKAANVENTDYGDRLVIYFDISAGDFREFFQSDFNAQTQEDKKWRGVYRMYLPKEDGSEKDGWTKRTLGSVIWAFESSNAGFHWNWDESKLKDKEIGVLFRNKEWGMDTHEGYKTGWTTECCALTDVASIKQGKFKMPKDKPLANKPEQSFIPLSDNDGVDLPWNT